LGEQCARAKIGFDYKDNLGEEDGYSNNILSSRTRTTQRWSRKNCICHGKIQTKAVIFIERTELLLPAISPTQKEELYHCFFAEAYIFISEILSALLVINSLGA